MPVLKGGADVDDLMAKLNDVLNDEESLKQIKELAGALTQGESAGSGAAAQPSLADSVGDIDISKLMALKGAVQSAARSDKNVALLIALKPLLKEEKQERIDKAIRLMRLISLLPVLKDSGILGGDLFGII